MFPATWVRSTLALVVLATASLPAPFAQDEATPPTPVQEDTEPTLEERRETIAQELESARAELAKAEEAGGATEIQRGVVSRFERIELLLDRQSSSQERRAVLQESRDELEAEQQQWALGGGATNVGFLALQEIREQLSSERGRLRVTRDALEAAQRAREAARRKVTAAERDQRLARDRLEGASSGDSRTELARSAAEAGLELREANEALRLAEAEYELVLFDKDLQDLRVGVLSAKVDTLSATAIPTEEDRMSKRADLAARKDRIVRARDMLSSELAQLDQMYAAAKRRAEARGEPSALDALEAETLAVSRRARHQQLELRSGEQERLDIVARVWERRFQLASEETELDLCRAWLAETEELLLDLETAARVDATVLVEVRNEHKTLNQRLENAPADDANTRSALLAQIDTLGELIDAYEADTADIERTVLLLESLRDDLRAETITFSPRQALQQVGESLSTFWNYELTTVQDSSIRVRTVVTGLLLVVLGMWISRRLSGYLANLLLRRMGFDAGAVAAIRSLAFYALVVTFGLFALRIVEVPLTVFTLLGGALAIGVGFGSQNLVNNFLSGLILLIERPVRVGDLVEVGGLYGNILNIGARSTSVRTGDNVDIIVPNSQFLENNVVNWTLGDDTVRVHVEVGVAYGSPVRDVQKLLILSATEHGKVLTSPAPFVLFTSFGDNALVFELHFWMRMRKLMDRRRMESDMRFKIDRLFRDAGIVIAFPQRDVHVDSLSPLKVQMVPPAAPEEEETEGVRIP